MYPTGNRPHASPLLEITSEGIEDRAGQCGRKPEKVGPVNCIFRGLGFRTAGAPQKVESGRGRVKKEPRAGTS